jgi:AcrR family transcriptional regulator
MARTKPEIDRIEKEEEILLVAKNLFLELGYDATSVGHIAKDAGVAPNTLYWYFADKDALLIAVLDRIVADAFRAFEKRKTGPMERQLLWIIDELKGVQKLITTVHARTQSSPAVDTWHTNFHRLLESALLAQLRAHGVAQADLEHAARVALFTIEGMLAHPTSAADQRKLVHWLVSSIGAKPLANRAD